nr:hypothetical protein OG781_22380 [Streptomyces sp. NBC_00830]
MQVLLVDELLVVRLNGGLLRRLEADSRSACPANQMWYAASNGGSLMPYQESRVNDW